MSSIALIDEGGWYMVDCGEATQHQLLDTRLSLHGLLGICVTHVHGDHCYGLPGLLASAGLLGRTAPLRIIAPNGIEDWLLCTQEQTRLHLPFALDFVAAESLHGARFDNWQIDSVALAHRVPSFAYVFTETRRNARLNTEKLASDGVPRGPLWGELYNGADVQHDGRVFRSRDYLVYRDPPRRIVVGGDNEQPALLADACRDAQLLIHEATYTEDVVARMGDSRGHSTAAAVASFAQAAGLPNLVLTHFSPRYRAGGGKEPTIDALRLEAARHYRGQLCLAQDFARFRLDKHGQLTRVAWPAAM